MLKYALRENLLTPEPDDYMAGWHMDTIQSSVSIRRLVLLVNPAAVCWIKLIIRVSSP